MGRVVVGLAAAWTALNSCHVRSRPLGPAERIEAEISGCSTVDPDGACVLDDEQTVRVWVPKRWPAPQVVLDGLSVAPEAAVGADEGVRLHVHLTPQAHTLVVDATTGKTVGTWSVAVRPRHEPPALRRAREARRNGHPEAVLAALGPNLEALGPCDRAHAEGLLARAYLARGSVAEAAAHFNEALARDEAARLLSDWNRDAMALAFVEVQRTYKFDKARALLERARPTVFRYPDDRAQLPYYEGLLAVETGDLRGALEAFRSAQALAERLGLAYAARTALDRTAVTLQLLGRRGEAEALLERLRATPAPPEAPGCDAVDILNNLGWLRLGGWRSSAAAAERAQTFFRDALQLFPARCSDAFRRANVLTNLAIAATHKGDTREARLSLSLAREAMKEPNDALTAWWRELDGEVALEEGDRPRALRAFSDLLGDATLLGAPETRWRALLGRGMALEELRVYDAADRAYAEAERTLDRVDVDVPLGEGRGTFLRDHVESAIRRIDLDLRRRRWMGAAATAEHSAARLLESVMRTSRFAGLQGDERARLERALGEYRRARDDLSSAMSEESKLPSDERDVARRQRLATERALRTSLERTLSDLGAAPAQGEPVPRAEPTLIVHPATDGWFILWRDADRSWGDHVPSDRFRTPEEAVADILRGSLHADVALGPRLSVLAYGELAAIDVHALPWKGAALIDRSVVTYPLGVHTGEAETGRRAAVIGDPSRDLPAARAESIEVAGDLAASAWQTETLFGGAATHAEVTRIAGTVDLLHYAGHALRSGLDGWESHLVLAGSDELTVADILALPRAPRIVVLLGCDAGRATETGASQTLALAQAFVTAGTQVAIAPTRPVPDADAARLSRHLYANVASMTDWPAALRAAVIALRAENPRSDWAAYRAFVP